MRSACLPLVGTPKLAKMASAFWQNSGGENLVKNALVKNALVNKALVENALVNKALVKNALVNNALVKQGLFLAQFWHNFEATHPFMTKAGSCQVLFAPQALMRTYLSPSCQVQTRVLERFAWPPNSRAHQRARAVEIKTWHHEVYVCVRAVWIKQNSLGTNNVHGIARTHLALDDHP